MNLTVRSSGGKVYTNCECIKGFAFKMAGPGAYSALLTPRAADFGLQGDHSAHFDAHAHLSPLIDAI
jgi:hypothetical protein